MWRTLLCTLVLCASTIVTVEADELQYFGFYGPYNEYFDGVDPATDHANFFQADSIAHAIQGHAAGQSSVLTISEYFPGLYTTTPDFKTKWEPVVPVLKALLANGTIFGFNLGDELVWSGMPPTNLVRYADAVRASFPRGDAVIWYNEACFFSGPKTGWHNGARKPVPDYTIPRALDWFSIDLYHMDGPVDGWVQANVKPWYERNVYPNLTSVQRVLVVPGAYGSHVNHYPNGTYVCDNACYDKMCETDAHDFYTWGLADPMVVAIAPWDWGGCPTCNGSRWTPPHTCCMDEIGAKDQPLTKAAWFQIGDKIKKKKQKQKQVAADIPF